MLGQPCNVVGKSRNGKGLGDYFLRAEWMAIYLIALSEGNGDGLTGVFSSRQVYCDARSGCRMGRSSADVLPADLHN